MRVKPEEKSPCSGSGDGFNPGQERVEDSCKHGNEPSGSKTGGEFLSDSKLLTELVT
jgi:hypothetical protein